MHGRRCKVAEDLIKKGVRFRVSGNPYPYAEAIPTATRPAHGAVLLEVDSAAQYREQGPAYLHHGHYHDGGEELQSLRGISFRVHSGFAGINRQQRR